LELHAVALASGFFKVLNLLLLVCACCLQGEMRRVCDKQVALETKAKEQQALVRRTVVVYVTAVLYVDRTSGVGGRVVMDAQLSLCSCCTDTNGVLGVAINWVSTAKGTGQQWMVGAPSMSESL
jgi:hypothetical protein